MILEKKREEKQTGEEAGMLNAPDYLSCACPGCGSFTLFALSDDGDVECDTCGEEVRQTQE